jgi:hypothetical protein
MGVDAHRSTTRDMGADLIGASGTVARHAPSDRSDFGNVRRFAPGSGQRGGLSSLTRPSPTERTRWRPLVVRLPPRSVATGRNG